VRNPLHQRLLAPAEQALVARRAQPVVVLLAQRDRSAHRRHHRETGGRPEWDPFRTPLSTPVTDAQLRALRNI
jgi:hypothetical protein